MKTHTVVYTASFGHHDKPQEIYDLPEGILPICFTDDPSLTRKTWHVRLRPKVFAHPRMDAKWYKMSACHLFPGVERSLYIDSSIWTWNAPRFVDKCFRPIDSSSDKRVAFFEHPEGQTSIAGEAAHSMTMPKYEGAMIWEQVEHYRQAGFSVEGNGKRVFAGGIIARTHKPDVARFEKAWLDECVHWSVQDQVSLPYVFWQQMLSPGIIPGDIYHDDHHLYLWSGPGR